MHDVVVVGCGPVGALLAARLATRGLDVVVLDREPAPYPLPRGVAADGEVLELLERAVPGSTRGFLRDPEVRFLGADGGELARLRFPVPGLAFFRQPVLEERLRTAAAGAGADLRLGTAATGLDQDADGVVVRTAAGPVRARWLVGCDGASSTVRHLAGLPWRGRDLPHRWVVCDVVGPPVPDRQLFTYTCDPARPQVDLPVPGGHRWEWLVRTTARGPHDPLALSRELLADVLDGREVVRAAEYRFGARRAGAWQAGRVLLAGDAAHTMPPFAGQGLGAGLRDAWALGALLPRGPRAVAGYQRLREPHLRRVTALSLALGAVLQAPHGARVRDALLARAFRSPGVGPWLRRGGPRPERSGVLDL